MTAFNPSPVISGAAAAELNPLTWRGMPRANATTEAQARKVGQDFEAMFLSQMLQPMFESMEPDPVFGGGYGEKMFRSLQVEEFAKGMARTGGIGLADAITREMLRMQEASNG